MLHPLDDRLQRGVSTSLAAALPVATVNGRYHGHMVAPELSRYWLDLRIDMTEGPNGVATGIVSGDIYEVPEVDAGQGRQYVESWVSRQATAGPDGSVRGAVVFWEQRRAPASVRVLVVVNEAGAMSVDVVLENGEQTRTFRCEYAAPTFRDLALQIDTSHSLIWDEPAYEIGTEMVRDSRHAVPRTLTMSGALKEAGVALALTAPGRVIHEGARPHKWTDEELFDLMRAAVPCADELARWPRWFLWAFLGRAYTYDAAGIMFDRRDDVQRRGLAIFRGHRFFDGLETDGQPALTRARRNYLQCWIHEIGHALNLPHGWRRRGQPASWMHNPSEAFWQRFTYQFDEVEIAHIRHANRRDVSMGGAPFMEAPLEEWEEAAGDPQQPNDENARVELTLRGATAFPLMAPVRVEVRIRNRGASEAHVSDQLQPADGDLVAFVQRPDGGIVEFTPGLCRFRERTEVTLSPESATSQADGTDRFSDEIDLTYGGGGFTFDTPGEYVVRAVCRGPGDLPVRSDEHRIRIEKPSPEVERLAQDYFSVNVGHVLLLQGVHAPQLQAGVRVIEELAARTAGTVGGARHAEVLMRGRALSFHAVQDGVLRLMTRASPQAALDATAAALRVFQQPPEDVDVKSLNLTYSRLVRRRAQQHRIAENDRLAQRELQRLRDDLAKRGVRDRVLSELNSEIERYS